MILENGMHFVNMILLDVIGMGIRQPEQSFGEVANHSVVMQKLLIVIPLRQDLAACGGTDDGALVSKGQLLFLNPLTGFPKQSCFPAQLHIEQQHACIDIMRMDEIFSVVIGSGGIFKS